MEYDYFLPYIANYLPWELYYNEYFKEYLRRPDLVNMDDYADFIAL